MREDCKLSFKRFKIKTTLAFLIAITPVNFVTLNQSCGSGSGSGSILDPDSIGFVDPDPDSESGSGSRRTKLTNKIRKK